MDSKNLINLIHAGSNFDTTVNTVRVSWQMTKWCNYQCPYCIQGVIHKDLEHHTQEYLENVAKKIRPHFAGKTVNLTLYGGEVSFYDLVSISKILFENNDCKAHISLITNFSNKVESYIRFIEEQPENVNVSITASYHWVNIGDFAKKAKEVYSLREKGFIVSCVVDSTKSLEDIKKVTEALDGVPLRLTLGREPKSKNKMYEYQEGVEDFIIAYNKDYEIKYNKKALTVRWTDGTSETFASKSDLINKIAILQNDEGANLTGMICRTGVQIKTNGDVRKSTCPARSNQILGNILTDENCPLSYKGYPCENKKHCNLCSCMYIWNGKF